MRLADRCPACSTYAITVTDVGAIAPFVAYRTGVDASLGRTCVCHDCGFRFCRVRFEPDEISRLYADYRGPSYNAERERFEPGYTAMFGHLNEPRDTISQIERWIVDLEGTEPERVLDIGGNDGRNTPFGDRAVIWDVTDAAPSGLFDLVVLAHVLEHVPYPRETVALARSFLNPDGLIYAEVPIDPPVDSWHEHIQQFSTESLNALFGVMEGYRVVPDTSVGPVRMVLAR